MTNLNRITLLGNTGKTPKAGSTASGKQVTRLSVATNKRYKDETGDWKSTVQWHNVVVYGPSTDYAAQNSARNAGICRREMSYREYEREVDGVKLRWPLVEIIVSSITALVPKDKSERGAA